ncbi:cold shock domain-containing protein [Novosphingopyxis sp.]|uniref:cold shock domain-containing protein n=1 Tax=Novosphingopyxis sp. TaxID=2709690 RepID=UPI003B5B88A4
MALESRPAEMYSEDPRNEASGDKQTDVMQAAGQIKWFDRRRGFGFIVPDDGGEDILIHCSTIEPHGRRDLPEGCDVACAFRQGPKGRHVVTLVSFDLECADQSDLALRHSEPRLRAIDSDADFVAAKVKWFSRVRGYGFLEAEDVEEDIFLHMETLREAGFGPASPDDQLMVQVGDGKKGPLAITVRQDHRLLS